MCQYILDTDCVSLILYNHPQVIANATKHQFAITIITVQELFNGWVGRINEPSQVHNLPALYSKLWTTVKYLQTIEVLNFTPEADTCLKKLLKDNPPLRKNHVQKDISKRGRFVLASLIGWVHIKKPNLFFYSQFSPFLPCQCDDGTESVPSSKPSSKSLNQLPRRGRLAMSAIGPQPITPPQPITKDIRVGY